MKLSGGLKYNKERRGIDMTIKILGLDLETVADRSAISILPEIKAPGNYKDVDKISTYIAEKEKERNSELGLDPTTCQIVCICARDFVNQITYSFCNDEKTMLTNFWQLTINYNAFCSFNGKSFDVPVLMFRSMINGVTPGQIDTNPYAINNHYDLRAIFTGRNKFQRGSLDFLCKRLGCPVEPFGSGGDIQAWYDSGDRESIVKHCQNDVILLEWLYNKMKKFYF